MKAQWLRYDSHLVSSGIDEYGVRWEDPTVEVRLHRYYVTKETPKGVWLDVYGTRKFVLRDARKRWACPTQKEALASFTRRKQRQVGVLEYQLGHAKEALRLARVLAGEPETASITEEQWNSLRPRVGTIR